MLLVFDTRPHRSRFGGRTFFRWSLASLGPPIVYRTSRLRRRWCYSPSAQVSVHLRISFNPQMDADEGSRTSRRGSLVVSVPHTPQPPHTSYSPDSRS